MKISSNLLRPDGLSSSPCPESQLEARSYRETNASPDFPLASLTPPRSPSQTSLRLYIRAVALANATLTLNLYTVEDYRQGRNTGSGHDVATRLPSSPT